MTRRIGIEKALRGEQDRTPCFPLVDVAYASAHVGKPMADLQLYPRVHAAALARCAAELPIDGVYINLCLYERQAESFVFENANYRGRIDNALEVQFGPNEVAAVGHTDIAALDDPRIKSAELFHPGMLETYRAMPDDVKREVAVCVGLTGAFSQVGFLLGVQNLMLALSDDPAGVKRAIETRQQVALRQAEELADAGARFIWIGEGMASASLLSPSMYTEFVLPYEQQLADAIRRLGCLSLLHICGNTTPTLAEIAQSRADGVDVDSLTDWPAAVRIVGKNSCVKGNVNPQLFLPDKLPELAEACRIAIRDAEGARGFILSTGCLVPRDSTRVAFDVMARAVGLD